MEKRDSIITTVQQDELRNGLSEGPQLGKRNYIPTYLEPTIWTHGGSSKVWQSLCQLIKCSNGPGGRESPCLAIARGIIASCYYLTPCAHCSQSIDSPSSLMVQTREKNNCRSSMAFKIFLCIGTV